MFVNFSEEVRHILKNAEKERDDLNHPYVGSEHLFLSILKNSKLKDILKKHKVTYDKFKEKFSKRIDYSIIIHPKQFSIEGKNIKIPPYMTFCL